MSTSRVVLVAVVAAALGAAIGAFGALKFSSWMYGEMAVSTAAAAVASNSSALAALRNEKGSSAIGQLEAVLDGELIFLTSYPGATDRVDVKRALDAARAYRAAYPRQSGDGALDTRVKQVLSSSGG